jgi:hypothetical protein
MIVVHRRISWGNNKPTKTTKLNYKNAKITPVGRGLQHLKYIQHRPGEDKEKGGREFFDEDGERVDPSKVRDMVRAMKSAKVVLHSLTLSPQINLVDKKALTQEVMAKFAQEKGQELQWVAVEHNNTDHFHVHVVLFGRDKNGKEVFVGKPDYPRLRELGDQHLERFHPIELAYALEKKERERKAKERAKELAREERIKEGLELPWLHKKIIREQLEPYDQWKNKQRLEKKQREKNKDGPQRQKIRIEAAGKEWTSDNTLAELRDLNKYLWDNYGERIDHPSYCKLVAWIKEKESLECSGKLSEQESKKKDKKSAEKDYLEYKGKKYSEKSSYEDLRELSSLVHAAKAERLPIEDYQNMRAWLDNADRARWKGILDKQIELGKKQHDQRESQRVAPNNCRAPGSVPSGPVAGMFGPIAAAGRFAYEMVMLFDFGSGEFIDRDRKTREIIHQPDMHRPINGG